MGSYAGYGSNNSLILVDVLGVASHSGGNMFGGSRLSELKYIAHSHTLASWFLLLRGAAAFTFRSTPMTMPALTVWLGDAWACHSVLYISFFGDVLVL